ncbi:MAG: LysR family transcriptional regulator, partial [Rhodocyclaceae bacterium]|nr:LysR family transcriptional regulator [Rhodocyclaceae bacterium]
SISKAAKAVPLSYKAAWDAIDTLNNLAPEPLVIRATGGNGGGGTVLTESGRQLVAFYRALQLEQEAALARLAENLATLPETASADVSQFRQLIRRLAMKSSARNQFAGPVIAIKEGMVDCEVTLGLGPELQLTALITMESAENLGIELGTEVQALVKSSAILVTTDEAARISARNRYCGEITHLHEGPVNAEVTLALPGGRHVITAVITDESLKSLDLKVGGRACAVFKASSVFLAVAA